MNAVFSTYSAKPDKARSSGVRTPICCLFPDIHPDRSASFDNKSAKYAIVLPQDLLFSSFGRLPVLPDNIIGMGSWRKKRKVVS
jgi:hypothetical protein